MVASVSRDMTADCTVRLCSRLNNRHTRCTLPGSGRHSQTVYTQCFTSRQRRSAYVRAQPEEGQNSEKSVEPADIIAEDQGGQEFDPASSNEKYQEPETSQKGSPQENSADVEDVAEKDQGGREFEPMPVKRILVD